MAKNTAVIEAAKESGFHAVDTFMMTASRYKEFYQGACACHFHKVGVYLKKGWVGFMENIIVTTL